MTTKLYKKAFAGVVLAVSLSLTGGVLQVKANPSLDVAGVQGSDLLAPHVNGDTLMSGGSTESERAIADIVTRSLTGTTDPVNGFSPRTSRSNVSQPASQSMAAQPLPSVAQGNSEDTFSPPTNEDIRQQLLINPETNFSRPQPIPSSTFLTPSAYGADWGDGFVGVSGVTGGDVRSTLDGSAIVGVGLGNAVDNIGIEVTTAIISLDGFAEDGTVGFKLHKIFPQANNLAIAAGWSNAVKWGSADLEPDTFYGVVTQRFDLRGGQTNTMPLTASLGVGTGEFRSTGAIRADSNDPNVFGSLGLRVIPDVSVITNWTGSGLGLGLSATPFDTPLVLTAGVSDLTDNTANGTRFIGSLGYSFSF